MFSAGDGTVSEIEPSTGAVLATYTVGYSPNGLAYADGDLSASFTMPILLRSSKHQPVTFSVPSTWAVCAHVRWLQHLGD